MGVVLRSSRSRSWRSLRRSRRCWHSVWIDWALPIVFFFFQAEDGIRDHCVTGVQTCALPIYARRAFLEFARLHPEHPYAPEALLLASELALGKPAEWSAARALLDRIIADYPKQPRTDFARLNRALLSLRTGDAAALQGELTDWIKRAPFPPLLGRAHVALGIALLTAGKPAEAAKSFTLARSETGTLATLGLGVAHLAHRLRGVCRARAALSAGPVRRRRTPDARRGAGGDRACGRGTPGPREARRRGAGRREDDARLARAGPGARGHGRPRGRARGLRARGERRPPRLEPGRPARERARPAPGEEVDRSPRAPRRAPEGSGGGDGRRGRLRARRGLAGRRRPARRRGVLHDGRLRGAGGVRRAQGPPRHRHQRPG